MAGGRAQRHPSGLGKYRKKEGETTRLEAVRLELQDLLRSDDNLAARLEALPGRVFATLS